MACHGDVPIGIVVTKSWVLRKSILQVFLKSLVNRFSMKGNDSRKTDVDVKRIFGNNLYAWLRRRGGKNFELLCFTVHERVRD